MVYTLTVTLPHCVQSHSHSCHGVHTHCHTVTVYAVKVTFTLPPITVYTLAITWTLTLHLLLVCLCGWVATHSHSRTTLLASVDTVFETVRDCVIVSKALSLTPIFAVWL